MSKPLRLSATVDWTCTPIPLWRRLLRRVPAALAFALDAASPGASSPALHEDVDPQVTEDWTIRLGTLTVMGRGAGLPDSYPSTQAVSVYLDRATIHPGLVEVELPLDTVSIASARPVGLRWTRRDDVDAHWEIQAIGPDVDLTLRGRRVLLAHLGTLGGWPEPG